MSDIKLTCDETPLSWPASITIDELKVCKTCGIQVHSPQPGSLQILTRRQGDGHGDGVNIDESISVGADYRGQRYSLDEAIFHTPGLHMFPGRKELYPAEYHVHMRTMTAPIRYLTLVIPASHIATDSQGGQGKDYFAAMKAKPDPAAKRPTLDSLLTGKAIKVIQYQGPDIRGRTGDKANQAPEATCNSSNERQFLLVLNVAAIRATDLERIPREGSLSTDPRDLPAPGVTSKKAVTRDRLIRVAVLADPGILPAKSIILKEKPNDIHTTELECKPIKVVDGRDVIDVSGKAIDIKTLLGLGDKDNENATDSAASIKNAIAWGQHATMFAGTLVGLLLADFIIGKIWSLFFNHSARLEEWEPLKIYFFLSVAIAAGGFSGGIIGLIDMVIDYVRTMIGV